MNQENEFDKTLKDKISQMNFEFKDSYWNEMEALLDKKSKKRGFLLWWVSGISFASLFIAGAFFFFAHNGEIASTNNASTNIENIKSNNPSTAPKHENIGKEEVTENALEIAPEMKNKHNNQTQSSVEFGNNNQNTLVSTKKSTENMAASHHHLTNTESNSLTHQTSEEESIKPSVTNISQDDFKSNPSDQETLNNLVPLDELYATKIETEALGLASFSDFTYKGRTWSSHVGIHVGTNFGQSFNGSNDKVGGMGSQWGLRFYFASRKGLQLNTGLSFGVNAINGLIYEETRKVFGFNQYDLVNTIHYKSMLTAHVPLYIGYEAYRFSIAGGLRLNYIMNTRGRVFTWDNSIVDQNIWGYAHGIKFFNMACGLETSYQISRRFDLGVNLDIDLSSRSEENNTLISSSARLWQTGFFLKYRLN